MSLMVKPAGSRTKILGRTVKLLQRLDGKPPAIGRAVFIAEESDPPAPALPGQLGFWGEAEIVAGLKAKRRGGLPVSGVVLRNKGDVG